MRACDVPDDQIVVDATGAVWRPIPVGWTYFLAGGWSWDARPELPPEYEPYVALDAAASYLFENLSTSSVLLR